MKEATGASELQRRAMAAWGSMPAPRARMERADEEGAEAKGSGGGSRPAEEVRRSARLRKKALPVFEEMVGGELREGWSRGLVEMQPVFFNTWYAAGTRLTGRSTEEVEREAVEWARAGVLDLRDLLTWEGRLIVEAVFRRRYPGLSVDTYRQVQIEMPEIWKAILQVPRGVENPTGAGYEVRVEITPPKTLRSREPVRVGKMGVHEIYTMRMAQQWCMPSTFQEGGDGHVRWMSASRPQDQFRDDVAEVYGRIYHPAIPRWMSDVVFRAATGADLVGPRVFKDRRAQCNRCGGGETCSHKYGTCGAVVVAWARMLGKWKAMTGETVDPTDEWVTVWGLRWSRRQAGDTKCPMEEAFRVIHASMVVAIDEESRRKKPGGPEKIVQRACALVPSEGGDHRPRSTPHRRNAECTHWGLRPAHRADCSLAVSRMTLVHISHV
jgi:hypothetical protein